MQLLNSDVQVVKQSGFGRAFVPGMVLGLVVGGLAGAVLPEFMPRMAGGQVVVNATAARNVERVPEPAAAAVVEDPAPESELEPEPMSAEGR